MPEIDPRAPVIAGAGQVTWREKEASPAELMATAAELAAEDAGDPGLLGRVGSVSVVDCFSWQVPDPGAVVAGRLGLDGVETVRSVTGGTAPMDLLADACRRIASGACDACLVLGAEAMGPRMAAVRGGPEPDWPSQPPEAEPTRVIGRFRQPSHQAELDAGLVAPVSYYPLFEHALRRVDREDRESHRHRLDRLWTRFADVARANPHAWTTDPPGHPAIPGEGNRMVADPYPKLLTANIQVDQGAALLVTSAGLAAEAAADAERLVHVHAIARADDRWFCVERRDLHRSPATAGCGRAVLGHAHVGIADVGFLDLYSCFPSAVRIAGRELGIDPETDPRPPTATGGLTFAGGPASNYCTHAIASLVPRLRENPGSLALSTAVGWYMTKHAACLLASRPPDRPFAFMHPEEEVVGSGQRSVARDARGQAPIEAHTTIYSREGLPSLGIVTCILEDGRRAVARAEDEDTLAALATGDPETAVLDGRGAFELGPVAG